MLTYFCHFSFRLENQFPGYSLSLSEAAAAAAGVSGASGVHAAWQQCIVDSSQWVKRIPGVFLMWATTHRFSRHGAFSNDCWCGTSGSGEELEWSWSGAPSKTS